MKYALIGCGRISGCHIDAARKNGLEIAAICDIDRAAMLEKKEKLSLDGVRMYEDYREMLEKEKPALVAIATWSGEHARIALDCIEAGCHVIIEKPIALSIADADAVIAAGKRKGVLVCTNHQNRFNRAIQYIKKAEDEGRFGKLSHGTARICWSRGADYYGQAPWRGTWAQDGGCLMNQCIHNIDLLLWLMGDEAEEVTAYTDRRLHQYMEAEDLGLAIVKFRNGAYGMIEGTTNVYRRDLEETLYIFGEKGTAKAGGCSVNLLDEAYFADGEDDLQKIKEENSEIPGNVYGFGHPRLYADMIDAIRTGREPLVNGEAGKRALEMILAIYRSAAEHRPVKLPLACCATLDFAGRFDQK